MKGIYFQEGRATYREDLPMPVPAENESLIRILYTGICNTDREILKGYRPNFRGVMGHEFVGIVEMSSDPYWIGRRVVGELNAGCGHCIYCRTGREKHCPERKVIGMDGKDGCFAEYMTLATHLLHEVPDGLPLKQALLTEPLAAALEIPQQVHIFPDMAVAIIGDGRLAYLIASVLHLEGAELTIIGKHPDKLARFADFGKTRLLKQMHGDRFQAQTNGRKDLESTNPEQISQGQTSQEQEAFEVVVEASGSPSGLKLASGLVRRQGIIVLKSTYAGTVEVDMSQFVVNEITIKGSRCGPFLPALRLLEKRLVKLPAAEFYELKDWENAFASEAFKAGFVLEEEGNRSLMQSF